jgi:hypothetical protein
MRSSQEEDACAAGHASLGSLVLPQLSLAQVKVFRQEPEEQKIEKLPQGHAIISLHITRLRELMN